MTARPIAPRRCSLILRANKLPHWPIAPGARSAGPFIVSRKISAKGAAIRTALSMANGDVSVIHDADLEYHPRDLINLLRVFIEQNADAVYGSRFAGAQTRRVLLFRHQ